MRVYLQGAAVRARAILVRLAHANLVLALAIGAMTRVVQVMAGLPLDPVPPLVVFLLFYAIYTLDRAADAGADGRTHPERARFSTRHMRLMRASAVAAYAGALALAGTRGMAAVGVALLPLAALTLYSFPVLPRGVARRVGFARLKEVLVLKNLVVAGTLSGTATLLPVVAAPGPTAGTSVAALGGFLFGRWWINSVVFDVRDERGDRANGLRTIPVVLGRARTLRILHAGNAVLAAAVLVSVAAGVVPPPFGLLAASSVYAWGYLRALERGGDDHFLCDVVSDGELLVLAAALLLVL